jgi:hypothetical protein
MHGRASETGKSEVASGHRARLRKRLFEAGPRALSDHELVDQAPRQRLGVDARDGEGEEIFDQLMIKQRLWPAVEQAPAQAAAMSGRVTPLIGHLSLPNFQQ